MMGDQAKSEAPEALDAANAWLDTEAARQWFGDIGSPPWRVRPPRKGGSAWPAAFIENRARLEEQATPGPPSIVKPLNDLGLLPLFEPCLTPRITEDMAAIRRWHGPADVVPLIPRTRRGRGLAVIPVGRENRAQHPKTPAGRVNTVRRAYVLSPGGPLIPKVLDNDP